MGSIQVNKNISNVYNQQDKRNTKVCKDIGKCSRPDCLFAHSLEEFSPMPCSFARCRFFTEKEQKCTFFHDQETKEEYIQRIGVKFPVQKSKRESEFSQKRTDAFLKLLNKEEVAKTLVKSKLCNNFKMHGKCDRASCTFAHGLDELIPPKCAFENTCKYFSGARKGHCDHIHPAESREEFFQRMGYTTGYTTLVSIPEEDLPPIPENLNEFQYDDEPPKYEDVSDKVNEETNEEKKEDDIKVYRIPKEFGMQILEFAIKNGITNFRIEIVE